MRRFHRSAAEVKMWRSPSERSERRALRRVMCWAESHTVSFLITPPPLFPPEHRTCGGGLWKIFFK